jgi:hypothetical protein
MSEPGALCDPPTPGGASEDLFAALTSTVKPVP